MEFTYALQFDFDASNNEAKYEALFAGLHNKKQLVNNPFKDRREKLNIKQRFAFVKHPQSNGLVERENMSLGEGIKVRYARRETGNSFGSRSKSKAKTEKYFNAKVRDTSFKTSDYVYRNNDASHMEDTRKLGLKWEGPYEVVKAVGEKSLQSKERKRRYPSSDIERLKPQEMLYLATS
nr:reverse transcriptase domain-containing protein [Tanacetum cinerariifolium]